MMQDTLEQWIEYGWLNRLDKAFADFLYDLDRTADEAVLWAGALLSHQLGRGEVYLDLENLCANPSQTLAIPNDEAWQTNDRAPAVEWPSIKTNSLTDWRQTLENSRLVALGAGDTPLVLSGNRLYLRRYWQYQQTVEAQIQIRLQAVRDDLPKHLSSTLAELFEQNNERPDWQKIACVLAFRARFAIVTGGPGTGKTTTLTKLLSLLIELAAIESKPNPVILLAAPTGKAAARVSESIAGALERLSVSDAVKRQIPKKAGTLHRLLGSRPDSRRYKHDKRHPLMADIVIVDEASMIDLEMMATLLDALPATAQLILLGDKDQLASVEAGSVMGDLCRAADLAAYDDTTRAWISAHAGETLPETGSVGTAINQQTVMLRHSHRFGSHSGIGRLAKAVNAGDAIDAGNILGETHDRQDLSRLSLTDAGDPRFKRLILEADDGAPGYGHYLHIVREQRPTGEADYRQWAWNVLKAFDCFQLLCALRGGDWGTESLNQRIERWLFEDIKAGLWYEGRPVMIRSNDYNLGLMNGDIGITLRNAGGKLRVAFPGNENTGGNIRWISPMRLPDVETAFAMTVHKSQGSEFDHVALVLPPVCSPVLSRELIYTGVTRAKHRFTLLESRIGVLEQAIRTRTV